MEWKYLDTGYIKPSIDKTANVPQGTQRDLPAVRLKDILVGYIVQDLRLATNPAKHKPPEFQLLVTNADRLGDAIWAE